MRYGDTQVLDGVDLTVHSGEVVALLGPNGAGRSTTIEILEGFRVPSAGEVSVLGVDPAKGDDGWRSQIGVMLQTSSDHAKWRPRQLLAHIADYYRPYVDPWPADELLELVGLTGQAGQKLSTLSGGQRRRLDVALGIVGRPSLLFLDEPTTGFDPRARRDFHELVHRLSDLEGITILLTTHDLSEAEKLASRIVILAGGGVIADGSPYELTRAVSRLAEVRWVCGGQRHVHASKDATEFARELLTREGEPVTELEIERGTLEDAYLSIVERFEAGQAVEAASSGRCSCRRRHDERRRTSGGTRGGDRQCAGGGSRRRAGGGSRRRAGGGAAT
ncbi:ABC transporter ATP-binding protein [Leucobacter sp. CSA1]|uniref:ABC transporter ATP-binding protein n=2 Tax=Leucobacter chromiisoli TaxID=2796471 RepID=A0A934Q5R8_9MICO|nr:ABC transporter ATP-binding protein [Leucobacter chromiisoli]